MEEINKDKIKINEFEKKTDGSWVCVKNSDVMTKSGKVIRVMPGTIFRKDVLLWDCDIAKALDEVSAN